MDLKEIKQDTLTVAEFRDGIEQLKKTILDSPTGYEVIGPDDGTLCPLKHEFGEGIYIREITMFTGQLIISKIHKTTHPYFVMKGDVSVLTDKGVVRIKAPYHGITKAGTQRALYIHEDTVWATCHATKETDLEKIEEQIIAKSFDELENIIDIKEVD